MSVKDKVFPHPSTASSRNQIKFSRGWTKGGPFSKDGCFSVYVLNTTEALFLFFKQRNLEGGGSQEDHRRITGGMDRNRKRNRLKTEKVRDQRLFKKVADEQKMDPTAGGGYINTT